MVNSHGRFVWYELMTTDIETAKAFYANVVGWGTRDASAPGLAYSLFTSGDSPVTGLMNVPEGARRTGVTPQWMGYVGVDDVDAAVDRIKQLGGAVRVPPTDLLHRLRATLPALNYCWRRLHYLHYGSYEDEKDVLIYFRERELQLREAVQIPTWSVMRENPAVKLFKMRGEKMWVSCALATWLRSATADPNKGSAWGITLLPSSMV